ncbi:unnamed protein product [Protopolystoma xenopodis]|uniref:Uncharacterized protein n=1 Tax=Protopolystoma xenopodis TaxID=117903 RepID=A0A448WVP6_9PLAT|nr:unnamed protein product [Protopolystoma xenopodis]
MSANSRLGSSFSNLSVLPRVDRSAVCRGQASGLAGLEPGSFASLPTSRSRPPPANPITDCRIDPGVCELNGGIRVTPLMEDENELRSAQYTNREQVSRPGRARSWLARAAQAETPRMKAVKRKSAKRLERAERAEAKAGQIEQLRRDLERAGSERIEEVQLNGRAKLAEEELRFMRQRHNLKKGE